jgi:hypothetical protein
MKPYNTDDQGHVQYIMQSDMFKCPFAIMVPEHYRPDGSCKCNDPAERQRMIDDWEYTEQDFIDAGILRSSC